MPMKVNRGFRLPLAINFSDEIVCVILLFQSRELTK